MPSLDKLIKRIQLVNKLIYSELLLFETLKTEPLLLIFFWCKIGDPLRATGETNHSSRVRPQQAVKYSLKNFNADVFSESRLKSRTLVNPKETRSISSCPLVDILSSY